MIEPSRDPRPGRKLFWLFLLIVTASRLATLPKTLWEFDESLFLSAIDRYEPLAHHPPPPGYPLFIAAGKLVTFFLGDPFIALVFLSTLASVLGAVALSRLIGAITGSPRAGIAGSLLFYFSPSMLVHSTLPISDPGALALLAASALLCVRLLDRSRADGTVAAPSNLLLSGISAAVCCAATVGYRPQYSIAILPLLALTVLLLPGWRAKLRVTIVFTIACFLWLLPMAMATGGVDRLMEFELGQAGYFASHDADMSRSGWTTPQIVLRFIAHPWGVKALSFPVLIAAAWGSLRLLRARRAVLPVVAMWIVYTVFCLIFMDPADGARYALPSVMGTSIAAAAAIALLFRSSGLAEERGGLAADAAAWVLILIFGAASVFYVRGIISQRATSASPPFAAAEYAKQRFPPGSVALYELPLWPQAMRLLPEFQPVSIDKGLPLLSAKPATPAFLYVDGASTDPGAVVFRWNASDAYSKLTRNHYRIVSIVPLLAQRRFEPVRGVYSPEREVEGEAWRWLAPEGQFRVPSLGRSELVLVVGLPKESDLDVNRLTVTGPDRASRSVAVTRGQKATLTLPIPPSGGIITFRADRSVIPGRIPGGSNRDPRQLAVQLYSLEQTGRATMGAVTPVASAAVSTAPAAPR